VFPGGAALPGHQVVLRAERAAQHGPLRLQAERRRPGRLQRHPPDQGQQMKT